MNKFTSVINKLRFSEFNHPSQLTSLLFSLSFLFILCGIVAYFLWPGTGTLIPLLIPRSETYTELYFENHRTLPKGATSSSPATFSATIHNLEGKEMTYPVEVFAQQQDDLTKIPLLETQQTLAADETRVLTIEFRLPNTLSGKAKITVLLKNIDQSIHFWTYPLFPQASIQPSPEVE